MKTLDEALRALADPKYREFHCGLIPTVPRESVLGVRVPEIRRLAKTLDEKTRLEFLGDLPHRFYDENMLHAAILCNIRDFDAALKMVEDFLPYVDNWAVCDALSPKCFSKNKEALPPKISLWRSSDHTYTKRFGIEMSMRHFLDESFRPEFLAENAAVKSDEYYVNMMSAWYFAEALIKQWDHAIVYFCEPRLTPQVKKMAIQKALDSFRISDGKKAYLRELRKNS